MTRLTTWLGPYVVDGETLYVCRRGPNSAPHDLYAPNSRLWELHEADFDDPSRPRPGGHVTRCVLPNDSPDTIGVGRLVGNGYPITYMPGWCETGCVVTKKPSDRYEKYGKIHRRFTQDELRAVGLSPAEFPDPSTCPALVDVENSTNSHGTALLIVFKCGDEYWRICVGYHHEDFAGTNDLYDSYLEATLVAPTTVTLTVYQPVSPEQGPSST